MRLRNKILFFIVGVSLAMAYPVIVAPKIEAHEEAIRYYESIILHEQTYLVTHQLEDGAIAMRPRVDGEAYVNPYFANFSALALMIGAQAQSEVVRDYIDWFFVNVNQDDSNHQAGSISDYVYTLDNTRIMSKTKQDYDSVDAYLAGFIMVLENYVHKSQDETLLIQYEDEWIKILEAFLATRNATSGLSMVSLSNQTQYLMDNSEVYGALNVVQNLFDFYWKLDARNLNLEERLIKIEAELKQWAEELDEIIEGLLFDEAQMLYAYGMDGEGKLLDSKLGKRFYPDGIGQLYPIMFGLDDPRSEQAKQLYALFNQHYAWVDFELFDQGKTDFYWFVIAYGAAVMKDEDRLLSFLANYEKRIMPDHPYPIYNAEVAWVIMACDVMIKHHNQAIERLDPFKILQSKS